VDSARSRESRSAGLGLCIAKTIAEAHGGKILVQSTPGAGSAFTIFLPLSA
jgi:signal transduction histidine kinase